MRQFVQIGTQDQDPRAALGKHRGKLQGQEAWIERMADRAHADDPIPALEMGLRIPCHRRHTGALSDTAPGQRRRHALCPHLQFGIVDPRGLSVLACSDNLRSGVPFRGVVEKLVEG